MRADLLLVVPFTSGAYRGWIWLQRRLRQLSGAIGPIVDVGCGDGVYVRVLRSVWPVGEVIARRHFQKFERIDFVGEVVVPAAEPLVAFIASAAPYYPDLPFDAVLGRVRELASAEIAERGAVGPRTALNARRIGVVMSAEQVVHVLDSLQEAGVTAWVDGGWAIDALVGEQTREHDDLDLVVPADAVVL